jgi:hypothetical protein
MADKKASACKMAMSRVLGAAFLNHQAEQLEKSMSSNGPTSGKWRDRKYPATGGAKRDLSSTTVKTSPKTRVETFDRSNTTSPSMRLTSVTVIENAIRCCCCVLCFGICVWCSVQVASSKNELVQ